MARVISEAEALTIGDAMRAERETRISSGMRINYLAGPLDHDNTRGLTTRGDDPAPYAGGWRCCDGVFCNTHPDTEWGRKLVMDWVRSHLRIVD